MRLEALTYQKISQTPSYWGVSIPLTPPPPPRRLSRWLGCGRLALAQGRQTYKSASDRALGENMIKNLIGSVCPRIWIQQEQPVSIFYSITPKYLLYCCYFVPVFTMLLLICTNIYYVVVNLHQYLLCCCYF